MKTGLLPYRWYDTGKTKVGWIAFLIALAPAVFIWLASFYDSAFVPYLEQAKPAVDAVGQFIPAYAPSLEGLDQNRALFFGSAIVLNAVCCVLFMLLLLLVMKNRFRYLFVMLYVTTSPSCASYRCYFPSAMDNYIRKIGIGMGLFGLYFFVPATPVEVDRLGSYGKAFNNQSDLYLYLQYFSGLLLSIGVPSFLYAVGAKIYFFLRRRKRRYQIVSPPSMAS